MRILLLFILRSICISKYLLLNEYYKIKESGRDSISFFKCGLLLFNKGHSLLIEQDFLKVYFIGVPRRVKDKNSKTLLCQIDLVEELGIDESKYRDIKSLILVFFKQKLPRTYHSIFKVYFAITSTITGKNKRDLPDISSILNLNCYNYFAYLRQFGWLKLRMEPEIESNLESRCDLTTVLESKLETLRLKSEVADYTAFINYIQTGSKWNFIFSPDTPVFEIPIDFSKFKYNHFVSNSANDPLLFKFMLINLLSDYRFPVKQNITALFELVSDPKIFSELPKKTILYELITDAQLLRLQHIELLKNPELSPEKAIKLPVFQQKTFLMEKSRKISWINEFMVSRSEINQKYTPKNFAVYSNFTSFLLEKRTEKLDETSAQETYSFLVSELIPQLPVSVNFLKNFDFSSTYFQNFSEFSKPVKEDNSPFNIIYYLNLLDFYQNSFVDYKHNLKVKNLLKSQIYFAVNGGINSIKFIYDLLRLKDEPRIKEYLVLLSISRGYRSLSVEYSQILRKRGEKLKKKELITAADRLLLIEVQNNSVPGLFLALMLGLEVKNLKNVLKAMKQTKKLNFTNTLQIWFAIAFNIVKRKLNRLLKVFNSII